MKGTKDMSMKLTEKATTELKSIIGREIEGKRLTDKAGLRVMVLGGGCSGFSYRMTFDENQKPEDKVFDVEGVKIVVDPKSYLYMQGTEIDYVDDMNSRGFKFNNPNSTGSCGCGHSFST